MSEENNKREYPVDPLALARLEICKRCKYYITEETRCKLCGCNIRKVVYDDKAECPVGKW